MKKLASDFLYKFSKDFLWDTAKYISPLLFGSGGYLMKGWIVATLLSSGSFLGLSYIKYLFNELNKIEDKILISQIIINIDDSKQNLKVGAFIHNCANQIIDMEVDTNHTRAIVNTSTHLELSLNALSLPPYGRADLWTPPIPLNSFQDNEEITVNLHTQINYGKYKENKNFKVSNSFKASIGRVSFKEGKMQLIKA